ncbi:MAG: hypothetical protein MO853_02170 [Candidatus Protistobacter heckmanni]|nr:hypothetical protein [Candidatus Protistobacter heckmanni]
MYSRLKRYGKLFDCLDKLDARIQAGDASHSDFFIFASDATPLPDILRAEAQLELGNPAKALELAKSGIAKIPDKNSIGAFSPPILKIEILPVAALSAILSGRREEGQGYLNQLVDLDIPYIGSGVARNLREVNVAKINMALGNYP